MRAPLLLSYAYFGRYDYESLFGAARRARIVTDAAPERPLLFLDSGAFSARTLGVRIDLDGYASWLHRWAPYTAVSANLDIIHDSAGSARNQRLLEERGLAPMPVFHAGSPWPELDRLVDAGYDYIGLGGMARHGGSSRLRPWLAHAFRRCGPDVRLHGFGMGNPQILRDFPFYSVDSSAFNSGARYGRFEYYDDAGRIIRADWQSAFAHAAQLRAAGIDPGDLKVRTSPSDDPYSCALLRLALDQVGQLRTMMRQRHGPIAPPSRPATGEVGPLVFISSASSTYVQLFPQLAAQARPAFVEEYG